MTARLEAAINAVRTAITSTELMAATDELKYAHQAAPDADQPLLLKGYHIRSAFLAKGTVESYHDIAAVVSKDAGDYMGEAIVGMDISGVLHRVSNLSDIESLRAPLAALRGGAQ